MTKNTVNTTEQKTKKTAKQIADERAVIRFKNEQLKLYNVKTQKELTAEQKKEFNAKLLVFKANLQKTAEQKTEKTADKKQKTAKQSKAKQTDKKQKQKSTEAKEQKQKRQADAIEAVIKAFTLKDTELKHDTKKHKITVFYKLGENKKKAVMEIFVTTKDFHICTKAEHENSQYHESWGFKYDSRQTDIKAIKAIYNTVLGVLKEEIKQKQTEQKQKKQKEGK